MTAPGADNATVNSEKKWCSSYNERKYAIDCFCLLHDTTLIGVTIQDALKDLLFDKVDYTILILLYLHQESPKISGH